MPKIPQRYLESVFYLYETVDDANRGERNGGTGFFFSISEEEGDPRFVYAVSCWHVVCPALGNARVARVNLLDGGFELLDSLHWVQHPDGDDLAAAVVRLPAENFPFEVIPSSSALTGFGDEKGDHEMEGLFGPGNEIFFVGRYVNHEGREKNYPVVRFGNVAMAVQEPIRNRALGINQESLVVESRSIGGFSGSPVFVYPYSVIDRTGKYDTYVTMKTWFIGVVWGHGSEFLPVLGPDRHTPPPGDPMWTAQNAGLMYVVPSWKLRDLLDRPKERQMRRLAVAEWKAQNDHESPA